MKCALMRSMLVLGLVAGSLMGGRRLAAAPELPKAADILARETEAMGGKAAQEKIKTVVMKGKLSLQGMKGRFARYHALPSKSYEEYSIEGLLTGESGVNGNVAWEKSSLSGARLLSGEEKEKAVREADPNNKRFKQARTVGEEKVEGKLAYKLQLTTQEGNVVIAHYDKETGLQVRQEVTLESAEGKQTLIMYFSDFKKVDGIVHPFTIKVVVGPAEVLMTVDRIEQNVDIPEGRFALPADVSRLLEKQKKQ